MSVGRRQALAGLAFASIGLSIARVGRAEETPSDDPWPSLATQIFGDQKLQDGGGVVGIDAPYRALDAAVVPITLRVLLPEADPRRLQKITLVIDGNPSPLAAEFQPGADSGMSRLTTNVRVNDYTNIHAVALLSDGIRYATRRFVKASGGCSAPSASRDADGIAIGTMRFRQFAEQARPTGAAPLPQAQLMIWHPNFSGMQMDQLSHLYIPARFVQTVRVWQGDAPLLTVNCGISIAENPEFRFDYRPNGATTFRAEMVDSIGAQFRSQWPATPAI
jgi:sulfur-oxidizing protein SoxY